MQPSLRYTSGAGYIVEYVAVLNLRWSVLFIISFLRSAMGLPKTCASREKALFFKICNTARGNFASHLLPCEAKQSLDCEQFLYQHFLILVRFLFFFLLIASLPINDLLKWSESRDLINRNNREAIIIANVTQNLLNQFLKQNGLVRSTMLQLKKGSHSLN